MVQCDPRQVDVAEAADVLLTILQVRDLYHQADTGNQKEEKKTKHSSLYLRSSDGAEEAAEDPRGVDVLLAILQVRDLYQQADTGNQKEEKKTKH